MVEFTSDKGVIVEQSSIEFVIVGPVPGRVRDNIGVVIRSKNAKSDLIGFASTGYEEFSNISNILEWLFSSSQPMNAVGSFPVKRSGEEGDKRDAKYWFAWIGNCSDVKRKEINDVFNLHVADLHSGIVEREANKVEWSLSPILFLCEVANDQRKFTRRILVTQFAVLLLILLYMFFAYFSNVSVVR